MKSSQVDMKYRAEDRAVVQIRENAECTAMDRADVEKSVQK